MASFVTGFYFNVRIWLALEQVTFLPRLGKAGHWGPLGAVGREALGIWY